MKKNIIGIFIVMLLIATAIPAVVSLKNSGKNSTVPSHPLTSMIGYWTEIQKLLASDSTAGDLFGISISLNEDTILIGAPWDDDNGDYSGSAYVFTLSGTTWTQEAKLLALDGEVGDEFGWSVSLDGDTALISAAFDDGSRGSTYVFTRTGTTWTQQQKLIASDATANDNFGFSVSLNSDYALIGADFDDYHKGSAYIFTRTGTNWIQQQKLLASDGEADDFFGLSVSLDGDTALIGSLDNHNGEDTGSAYVFTRTGTNWIQQQKLLALDGATQDYFGCSVSLDGDAALIGAYQDDDNGINSGSAYVFNRIGTTWKQQAKLVALDGAGGDMFGLSVSLNDDYALIGSYRDDDNGVDSGSAYVFNHTGATWTQQAKLVASDGTKDDLFGYPVFISDNTALIGAGYNDENGNDSGSAYIYKKNQPPNPPKITGPTKIKTNVKNDYILNTIDLDGDDISYFVDWGDTTNSSWTSPSGSGVNVTLSHTWTAKGTYTIKAKAKDIYNAESDWTILKVSVPRIKSIDNLFQQFLKSHPNLFPILQKIIQRFGIQ